MSHDYHPAIAAFLDGLRAANREQTAITYAHYYRRFEGWLREQRVDVLRVSRDHLVQYQVWIAAYRSPTGQPLALTTQGTVVAALKTLYRWLTAQGLIISNPALKIVPPKPPQRLVVQKDHLSLQEAIALIQSLVTTVDTIDDGVHAKALAIRDLALIALGFASGRRSHGLVSLRLEDVDLDRNELRVAIEKGRTGRVLPVAAWAIGAVRRYLTQARPIIDRGRNSAWLFVGMHGEQMSQKSYQYALEQAMAATIRRNPDLVDLPHKRITTHSLRVTFATVMFSNGCGIRSLNELMLHDCLSTTAKYTPIPLEDLRGVLRMAHPRA